MKAGRMPAVNPNAVREENDYYVEVSGSGIKEGSEILADLTNYNETTEGVENESKGEA